MEVDKEFIEADVRETIQSFSRGSMLSKEAETKYQGFLSTPIGKVFFQVVLLLACLSAYTFGPLFVSWSTMVKVPDAARIITVTPPALNMAKIGDWYGVELGYQPGTYILYVVKVSDLAKRNGVLPGDVVSRAWQGDQQIWPVVEKDDIKNNMDLIEMKCFLELKTPAPSKSCNLQSIDPKQPLSIDFDMAHVEVSNSKPPYFPISTTCVKCVLGAIILSLLAALEKIDNLKLIFNSKTVYLLTLPSLGWALAEVCEVLASSNMNPALYSVLSQSRILATALLMRFLLGTKQTTLQSLVLVSVTIVTFCYAQIPDYVGGGKFWNGFGDPQDVVEEGVEANREVKQSGANIGVLFAFLKIFLSVVMGVVGQKAMGDTHIKNMSIITMQAAIFVISVVPVMLFSLFLLWVTEWKYGFFGGVTVEFRHCVKDWAHGECLSTEPVALAEQGWDYRTIIVALFYGYRDLVVNAVLKVFDALIRNMVNATATLVTYFLSLAILGTRFNVTKCGLIFGIMLQFMQYAIAPKYVEPATIPASSVGVELKTPK